MTPPSITAEQAGLSSVERDVLDHLVRAWNAYLALPTEHPDDLAEFRMGVHYLQRMILCRPIRRMLNSPPARKGVSP